MMKRFHCSTSVVWSFNQRNGKHGWREKTKQSSRENSCEMEGGGGKESGQRDGREKAKSIYIYIYILCCPEIQNVVTGGSKRGRERVRQARAKLFYGGE